MNEEAEIKKKRELENKVFMKRALFDQIEEKKHKLEVEKKMNDEQARIWKIDSDNFRSSTLEENLKVYQS